MLERRVDLPHCQAEVVAIGCFLICPSTTQHFVDFMLVEKLFGLIVKDSKHFLKSIHFFVGQGFSFFEPL